MTQTIPIYSLQTYLYRLNRMLRHLSLNQPTVQLRYTPTHLFVRQPELFRQSFADDGIYSFSMFLVHNAGPCAPITIPQLRENMLHHGYLTSMQIHDQYPDLTHPQFNYQELSVILFLLYTNKLNPEFYRGRMLPYGVEPYCKQVIILHWESWRHIMCWKRHIWRKRRLFLLFLYRATVFCQTAPILPSFHRKLRKPSKFEENFFTWKCLCFSDLRAIGHRFRWKGLAYDVLFIVLSTTYNVMF